MRRQYRLRSSKEIENVLRRGRKSDGIFFRLIVLQNQCGHMRLALIAPRTADKKAVVRNRLRRRAREWARAQPAVLRIPADTVLIFKKQASAAPRKIFYKELARMFGIAAR